MDMQILDNLDQGKEGAQYLNNLPRSSRRANGIKLNAFRAKAERPKTGSVVLKTRAKARVLKIRSRNPCTPPKQIKADLNDVVYTGDFPNLDGGTTRGQKELRFQKALGLSQLFRSPPGMELCSD